MHGPTKLGHPRARQRQGHDHPLLRVMTKAKPLPPLKELQQLLDYDPETGNFYWLIDKRGTAKAGTEAGSISQKESDRYYRKIYTTYGRFYAHRIAYYFETGIDPGEQEIDHIDGNGLNNRFANLRLASRSQNAANRRTSKNNASGFKGVRQKPGRNTWEAYIQVNKQKKFIGSFATPELAHMAYCKAAAELHGDFARAM